MQHFDFNDFTVQFSMLHDQILTGASIENGVLRLVFGEYRIFRENYSVDTYYERYKDYQACVVEIDVHSFPVPEMNAPYLCMLKGELFRCLEMTPEELVELLMQLRAAFTFASVSNNDEIELQLVTAADRSVPRRFRDCEFRFGVCADAIRFIWQ